MPPVFRTIRDAVDSRGLGGGMSSKPTSSHAIPWLDRSGSELHPVPRSEVAGEGLSLRAFGDIAAQAGQREIRSRGGTSLLAANHVVHLEGEVGINLMNQAVFAKPLRALGDQAAQSGGHRGHAPKVVRTGFMRRKVDGPRGPWPWPDS